MLQRSYFQPSLPYDAKENKQTAYWNGCEGADSIKSCFNHIHKVEIILCFAPLNKSNI